MENATDALKIAFAMLVFVIAITIIFMLVGQAKSTSDTIMYYTDKTNFYSYKEPSTEKRVSVDQVVCSLYNYTKENSHIEIYDEEGNLATTFDLSEETNMPWIGNEEYIKQRINLYIYGRIGSALEINGYTIPLFLMANDDEDYFLEQCYTNYEQETVETGQTITNEKLYITYYLNGTKDSISKIMDVDTASEMASY